MFRNWMRISEWHWPRHLINFSILTLEAASTLSLLASLAQTCWNILNRDVIQTSFIMSFNSYTILEPNILHELGNRWIFSHLFDGYKLCISCFNKVNLSSSLFNFLSQKKWTFQLMSDRDKRGDKFYTQQRHVESIPKMG